MLNDNTAQDDRTEALMDQLVQAGVKVAAATTQHARREALAGRNALIFDAVQHGISADSVRALVGVKNVSSIHDVVRAERARRTRDELGRTRADIEAERAQLLAERDARHAERKAEQEAKLAESIGIRTVEEIAAQMIDPEGVKGAPTQETRDRNELRHSKGSNDERCILCSAPMKDTEVQTTGFWIHASTDGWLFPTNLTDEEAALVEADGRDMGWFIVGATCGRRIPRTHRKPVTAR